MTDPQQPISRRAAPSRSRILIAVAAAVGFVLLSTGTVLAGVAVGKRDAASALSPTATPSPVRPVPAQSIAPIALRTCSVSSAASSKMLGALYGEVWDTGAKTAVWSRQGDQQQRLGTVMKVVTAAAALAVLGPDYTITTQVVDGVTPGSITLVGHGDATLSALPAGKESVYPGAPKLSTLASQALAAYNTAHPGVPITQVVLDSTYWDPADNWDANWSRTLQTQGEVSEVTALQVDGDRANPAVRVSPRSSDPVAAAGAAFVTALGAHGVTTTTGQAENGAPALASVQSQPVSTLVKQMLQSDDNTLAEMLARLVSVKLNQGGTAASLQQAIPAALAKYAIPTADISIDDGSGLSSADAVSPDFLAQLVAAIGGQQLGLQFASAGLPVAGIGGNLASRFTGSNAVVRKVLHGFAGTTTNTNSLTGYFTTKDGTNLSFAFYAQGSIPTVRSSAALDSLVAAVYRCGSNLSSN